MKKVYYILILFGFLLSSCSEREEITNVIKHDLVFIGHIDNKSLTKTTLGGKVSDDVRKVLWNPEDKLAITVGRDVVEEFSYIGTEDNAQGEFSGLIEEGANYFAFYPYSEDKSITYKDNAFNITLPQVQNYKAGSFAKDTYPMLAKSNNFNLKFKALCGALELNLVGTESIKSITFSGNNAAGNKYQVSGAATVSTDYTDFPSILMSKTANTSVKLACGEKGVLLNAEKETAFFIVLPPATYHTFTLSIESVSGKTMIVNASKPLSITRAMSTETANLKFEDKVVEATYDYVDEYGVNHGKGVTVAGVVWAPVNCGYLAEIGRAHV